MATKGQASSKTASAGDLVETLLVLVGIVIRGCDLSLHSGQVQFGLVVVHPFTQDDHSVWFWYVPSLRNSGLPLGLTSGMSLHSGLPLVQFLVHCFTQDHLWFGVTVLTRPFTQNGC